MGLTVNINIAVPDLPDNDVWFANAQAWKNYWRNIGGDASIEPAATDKYVASTYNNALVPVAFNYLGVDYVVPTVAMFQSLLNRVDVLNNAFEAMRTQLKDAGLIENAQ